MRFDLLAIGDSSIDELIKIHDASTQCRLDTKECHLCLDYAGKIPVDEFSTSIAGNASNVVIGTAKLGLKSTIYSEFGDDQNAQRFISEYKRLGINTDFCILNKNSETNVHQIISYNQERTILSYHAKRDYKVQNWGVPKILYYSSLAEGFETFQTQLIEFINVNRNKILVVFNPGTYQFKAGPENIREFLKVTDILFVNKEEAKKIVQKDSLEEISKEISNYGVNLVVITDAQNGAVAFDKNDFYKNGIHKTELPIVDKTGAGDAFTSGFLASIFYGNSIKNSLKWGTLNASYSIRKKGAIEGLLTKSQILEKINTESFLSPTI